jgi:hypothetical protein
LGQNFGQRFSGKNGVKRALELGQTANGKRFTVPLDFVTRTLAIVAIRGAGKTVAATVLAEEMCEAGLPWIAFDPVGVWWGLRTNPDGSPGGYPVLIVGGQHGDLPLDKAMAGQLAEALVRENVCCVIDLKLESKSTWRAFVAEFCDRLMELQPSVPRHVFVEEAPEFVPQRPMGEQKRSLAAVDRLVRLGRNQGYGATIISQRFATVQKDVLTQCENLLAMRSIGKPDRTAVRDWIAECVSPAPDDPTVEQFLDSLTSLPDGAGWFWSPQWLKSFDRIKVRPRKTYHPGETRTVGQKTQQVELSDVREFVERFRPLLETPMPKTKTPARPKSPAGTTHAVTVPAREALDRLQTAEEEAARLRGQVADLHRQLGAAKAALAAVRDVMQPQFRALQKLYAELNGLQPVGGVVDRAPFEAWFPKLRSGARRILEVLLDRGGEASIKQLLVLTQRRDGGGWRADIGQLRTVGLVEPGDPVKVRVP